MQQRENCEYRSECRNSWLHAGGTEPWKSPTLLQEPSPGTAALSLWNRDSPSAMRRSSLYFTLGTLLGLLVPLVSSGWPVLSAYLKNRTFPWGRISEESLSLLHKLSLDKSGCIMNLVLCPPVSLTRSRSSLGDFLLFRFCEVFSTSINLLTWSYQ